MRYVGVSGPGGPEVMEMHDGPVPVPRAGEVLIRVGTAEVNRPDLSQRAGTYPPPPDASPILGLEVAGHITALGADVLGWTVGDAVCALVPGGGYAEFVAAPAAHCLPVPAGLTVEQAAALPEGAFTVWSNVFDRGRLKAGETFLVHGGTSGIGTMAIQLAHALGSRVFATGGGKAKCDFCVSLGAEIAVDRHSEDFVAEVLRATDGKGVDVVLDMAGGDYTARNLAALATDGRIVQIAVLRGAKVEISLVDIMRKRATITGSTLRPRTIEAKGRIAAALCKTVWPLIVNKKVSPVIDRVFPFADVVEAHRYLERGEQIGKVLLTVRQSD